MRLLYVFPHPDDESFGPAAGMALERRRGHQVHLLTLTRGGATRQRHRLGLSVEEMGRVREAEMETMAGVLDLTSLTVLDLPDGRLAYVDPREIERAVAEQVRRLEPDVLVTYPVHGISGFADHLVAHAVVKRLYCEGREAGPPGPRRLALYTLKELPERDLPFRLSVSPEEEIDVAFRVGPEGVELQRRALACYETYAGTIADVDPASVTGEVLYYELYGEDHTPPLPDLTSDLEG